MDNLPIAPGAAPIALGATPVALGELARTFFFLGLTSYGGPAIIAQIREAVLHKAWLCDDDIRESLAFCQMLPGPVGVQLAAHLGWRVRGALGAFIALTTYVTPAFLLMILLSAAYFRFGRLLVLRAALQGLRAATVGIVLGAIFSVGRSALTSWRSGVIAVAAAASFLLHIHGLVVLIGAGLSGALLLTGDPARSSLLPPGSRTTVPARRLLWPATIVATFLATIVAAGRFAPFYPSLGIAMAKIDLLAFGGGYTAVALMFDEAVTRHAWLSNAEFIDGLAFGQVTPGPVIVTATFIGYKLGGIVGAVFATVCVFLPSGLLLVVLAPELARLRRLKWISGVTRGLLAGFVGMLLFVLWQVARAGITNSFTLVLALGSIAALFWKPNPVLIVLGAMALAVVHGAA